MDYKLTAERQALGAGLGAEGSGESRKIRAQGSGGKREGGEAVLSFVKGARREATAEPGSYSISSRRIVFISLTCFSA